MKVFVSLGLLASLNLLFALLSQWYVVVTLGPGAETDAFLAGMVVPQLVLAVATGSLMHVLVPLLAGEEERRLRQHAWGFLSVVGVAFGTLALVLSLSAPLWMRLLVPGFSPGTLALAVRLTRIQQVGMVLAALAGVASAVAHARARFVWAELGSALAAAGGFALLLSWLPRHGITAAAWVSVARGGLQLLLLLPALGAFAPPRAASTGWPEAWVRLRPLLLGSAYYKTDALVDRFLASLAPAGGLSLLYIGQQLYATAGGILDRALVAPLRPLLAAHARRGDWGAFRRLYRRRLRDVAGLTVGGYVVHLLTGEPILRRLVGHGGVTAGNVETLWWIMAALGGLFVGGAMGQILATAFYAQGITATPTRIGAFGFTIGMALKLLGFLTLGLLGIALATTAYYLLNVLLLYVFLERQLARQRRAAA